MVHQISAVRLGGYERMSSQLRQLAQQKGVQLESRDRGSSRSGQSTNAGVAMDILRTHPLVIIGGVLQENPLYVPPDEFLQELEERRALTA